MALRNLESGTVHSAEYVTQSTNSPAITLDGVKGLSVISEVTVSTPSATTFVDADIHLVNNSITKASHGLTTGLKGQVSNAGGALPTGLSGSTDYFVIVVDANTYKLASSLSNANAGTAEDITAASGGGTHTFTPASIAGGAVKWQGSIDGSAYVDLATATSITQTANFLFEKIDPMFRYVRFNHVVTAGRLTVTTRYLTKGEG